MTNDDGAGRVRIFGRGRARIFGRLILVTAALGGAVVAIELACRIYVHTFPPLRALTREERAADPPPPYRHADYYSAEFIRELETEPAVVLQPDGEFALPVDVAGGFINVSGSLRVTTDQPAHPSRRVLVFGGSAIYAHEVPDRFTVPSFIQRSVNTRCPGEIAVFNYGVPGMNATQQVARLKTLALRGSDVVIFFDGFNEVYYTVLAGTRGVDPSTLDPPPDIGRLAVWGQWIHATADRWRQVSALADVVARAGERTPLEVVINADRLSDNLSLAGGNYRRALVAAQRQVDAAGARFFHFLQPHMFATALASVYRREMAADPDHLVNRAFQAAYSELGAAIAQAAAQGVRSVDLSRIFDRDAVPDEVFLDYVHVNHVGNDMIAAAMFEEIGPALGCRPTSRD